MQDTVTHPTPDQPQSIPHQVLPVMFEDQDECLDDLVPETNSTDPSNTTDPTNSTDPSNPTDQTNSTNPSNTTDPTNSTDFNICINPIQL